jgi:hypothetical protein
MPYMACNFHIALNFVSSWAVSILVTWQIHKIQQIPSLSNKILINTIEIQYNEIGQIAFYFDNFNHSLIIIFNL